MEYIEEYNCTDGKVSNINFTNLKITVLSHFAILLELTWLLWSKTTKQLFIGFKSRQTILKKIFKAK